MSAINRFNLIIIFIFILTGLSCDKNSPTESIETSILSGYIFQYSNGLIYRIPQVDVSFESETAAGEYRTTSDSLGNYRIELPQAVYDIICIKSAFDTTTVAKLTVTFDRSHAIRMYGPLYSVSGIVTDTLANLIPGAVVELEHLSDTTNADGFFQFDSLPPGVWSLSCVYDDYLSIDDSVSIENQNETKNLALTRQSFQVIDTLWINKDAVVQLNIDNLFGNGDDNGNTNFGNVSWFSVYYTLLDMYDYKVGYIFQHFRHRVFMAIPEFSTNNLDSAFLILQASNNVTPQPILISNLVGQWDESTITWNNQPAPTNVNTLIEPIFDDDLKWVINISQNLDIFMDDFGFRFGYQNDSCEYSCGSALPLYSSDNFDTTKRPYVLLYRSE